MDVGIKAEPLVKLEGLLGLRFRLGVVSPIEKQLASWSKVPLEEGVLLGLASTRDPVVLAGLLGREDLTEKVRERVFQSIAELPPQMPPEKVEEALEVLEKKYEERYRRFFENYRGHLLNALLARCALDERPWKEIWKGSRRDLLEDLQMLSWYFPNTALGLLRHPEPEVVRKVLKAELKANREDLLRREVLDYLVERRDFPHFALEFLRYVRKWSRSIEKKMGEDVLEGGLALVEKGGDLPGPWPRALFHHHHIPFQKVLGHAVPLHHQSVEAGPAREGDEARQLLRRGLEGACGDAAHQGDGEAQEELARRGELQVGGAAVARGVEAEEALPLQGLQVLAQGLGADPQGPGQVVGGGAQAPAHQAGDGLKDPGLAWGKRLGHRHQYTCSGTGFWARASWTIGNPRWTRPARNR